ncbi:signal peptidase II [Actinoallomurus sp. NBC_01490]|uniref:signal peptidase II n=1 Tax=Actinoallomurus sp. NBC_01490 TaxID=2903557 RepID=UPI002E2FABB1|nr:signal peptidase II [Actinoallomurus sp. NBC_01490]
MNPGQDAGTRPRRIGVLVAIAVATLALDAISKAIVVATLPDRPQPVELLGGLLTLRVIRNSGAAFNIGTGMTLVFTVIAAGVVVAILRYARRLRSLPWAVTLGLLLGGALGNLADRLFRSPGVFRGHVVDWIELPHWPVFNLADASIVCGGVLAVLLASRGLQVDGTVQRDDKPDEPDGSDRSDRPADPDGSAEPDASAEAPAADRKDVPAAGDDQNGGTRPDARR